MTNENLDLNAREKTPEEKLKALRTELIAEKQRMEELQQLSSSIHLIQNSKAASSTSN